MAASSGIYLFADFRLDRAGGGLFRRDKSGAFAPVTIGSRALDLLAVLIERRGDVVSKEELAAAVWPKTAVENGNLFVQISTLRAILDGEQSGQSSIQTVAGRGYRFVAPVRRCAGPQSMSAEILEPARADNASSRERAAGPPRLSILVLPFANLGGDPEQEYFADGVTESLTTDLSRISGTFVIGRSTAFAYKGKPLDANTIGRELNVRYILEGSVQRAGSRMRVHVHLIDSESGSHLWAERFDKSVVDLFDLQDEIVARLANQLRAELIRAEARRAERAPNPDSMDLYFQGMAWLNKGPTPDSLAQARRFFDHALSIDLDNIEALIGLARADVREGANFLVTDPTAAFAAAEAKLIKALSSVPDHARGHRLLGYVKIWTKRPVQGIAECERALELDRNLAGAHAFIGLGKIFTGRAEETQTHVGDALRLSPRDTNAHTWKSFAGIAKAMLGSYDPAAAWFRRAIEANGNYPTPYFMLAAALAHLGRLDEARSTVKAGLALNPAFTVSRTHITWTAMGDGPIYLAQIESLLEGMRKAGIPET
jgi:TolB-like protein